MASCRGGERATRARRALLLVVFALLFGLPAAAQAQVVQNCQPDQYLDRTAAGADRALTWDFSIASDSERCLRVQVGQTVVWNNTDFEMHPLAGQGGDTPNPISLHQNGLVSFNTPGTFGFVCSAHSSMKGAVQVVAAPPAAVPVGSPGLLVSLTAILLAIGFMLGEGGRSVY